MSLESLFQKSVVETVHGVTVVDRYRWLEDQDSPITRTWVADQQRRHDAYFANLPALPTLHAKAIDQLNVEVMDQAVRIGDRLWSRRRDKDHQQACIYMADRATGVERLLIDPTSMGVFASVHIHRVSDDGSLIAYELKQGGSDAKEIHFATSNGDVLPDYLPMGLARGLAFATGNAAFFYCHESSPNCSEHTIRYHVFGDASSDLVIYRCPREHGSRLTLLADEVHLGALYTRSDPGRPLIEMHLAKYAQNASWTPVFVNHQSRCRPFLHRGRVLVVTDHNAPNGKIVELSKEGRTKGLIVPESDNEILNLARIGESLYVESLIDGGTAIDRWTMDGVCVGTVDMPTCGSVHILPKLTMNPSSLFYSCESFVTRPAIYEYCPDSGKSVQLCESVPTSEQGRSPVVREVCYRSTDGTSISMYLVAQKDLAFGQHRPTVLSSYGGFGASMTPRFSALNSVLLELGAVLALPKIRGGSDFGKAWHEAARGRRHQVAIDDFIAAADWLVQEGLTTPRQLGTLGGSNAGLLVAAAMTQRPQLFRAVLCIAPLLDMVRYEMFDDARKWQSEYGTIEDAQDFEALYAYSPYHQLKDESHYPAILFVTGDKDDRCNPAHVRKMAAAMQGCENQTLPVLVDYSSERGHSAVLPLSARCDALARRLAFLCEELSIDVPIEVHREVTLETYGD